MSKKSCEHKEVYPNGNCASCGTFVTIAPHLQTQHKVVPRPKPSCSTSHELARALLALGRVDEASGAPLRRDFMHGAVTHGAAWL